MGLPFSFISMNGAGIFFFFFGWKSWPFHLLFFYFIFYTSVAAAVVSVEKETIK